MESCLGYDSISGFPPPSSPLRRKGGGGGPQYILGEDGPRFIQWMDVLSLNEYRIAERASSCGEPCGATEDR
jgi:hypothetical protein